MGGQRTDAEIWLGVAAGYEWKAGVPLPSEANDFSFHSVQEGSEAQPPIQVVPVAVSVGIKRPVREADHHLHYRRGKELRSYTRIFTTSVLTYGVVKRGECGVA
jgi:hypothetical protein